MRLLEPNTADFDIIPEVIPSERTKTFEEMYSCISFMVSLCMTYKTGYVYLYANSIPPSLHLLLQARARLTQRACPVM
jgi:dimeric dUTPase (all-alpha-NTP-PPase superfamily)